MNRSRGRVEDYRTYHRDVPEGRAFTLEVQFRSGRTVRLEKRRLMCLIARLLLWEERAESAEIRDFEGEMVVSHWTATRLWRAAGGRYGYPTSSTPFIVRGPIVGRIGIEEYPLRSLRRAIGFAVYWFADSLYKPDWVHVVSPNGRIVLSNRELLRMYHAEVRARGEPVVERVRKRA